MRRLILFLRALQHLAATAMMLGITLVAADLYLTLDRRQAQFETHLTHTIDALGKSLTAEFRTDLDPISQQAAGLLADARGKVNTLDVVRLNDAVGSIARSANRVDAALPDFLDCQQDDTGIGNKGCLYYRYSDLSRNADVTLQAIASAAPGIAKSAQTTSEAVAKAAPLIATSAAGIAASADSIGKTADKTLIELTKPKSLRQKIEAWIKFGVYAAARFL